MSDEQRREFSSSEYAKTIHGIVAGVPPAIDLHAEKALIDCVVALTAERTLQSAHDLSDGGLGVAVAECCFTSDGLSADINVRTENPPEFALFEESGARAVISVQPEVLARVEEIAAQYKVEVQRIGTVTRGDFGIHVNGNLQLGAPIDSLRQYWFGSLERSLLKK